MIRSEKWNGNYNLDEYVLVEVSEKNESFFGVFLKLEGKMVLFILN